jgi:ketosteroid isomerase-like protein
MPVTLETAGDTPAAAVLAVADEEFRAMASGDVAAFLHVLAPDVVFFPPNDAPKSGQKIAPWIGEFLKGYAVEFEQHQHDDVLVADNWAVLCTSFRWRVSPRAGGDALLRLGNTVRLFRRHEAGAWQLAREIWTTYPAT